MHSCAFQNVAAAATKWLVPRYMIWGNRGWLCYGKTQEIKKAYQSRKHGPYAMYRLGICFQTGTMTEQNKEKSARWIFAAAEAAYAPAMEWMRDYSFDDNAMVQAES